jgi:hypothetical protein
MNPITEDEIDMMVGGRKKPRQGTITLEEAKKRFNDYYMLNTNSKSGRFRAKMNDLIYQKPSKFTLVPGEPGSEKYLLEKGPKTFDMVGVDWFPEGTVIEMEDPDYQGVEVISRGESKLSQKEKELYAKHYKNALENETAKKSLVDVYWEKYKKGEISNRANKKGWKEKEKKKLEEKMKKEEESIGILEYQGEVYELQSDGSVINQGKNKYVGNINYDSDNIPQELYNKLVDLGVKIQVFDDDEPHVYFNPKKKQFVVFLMGKVYELDKNNLPTDYLGLIEEYLTNENMKRNKMYAI